MNDGNKRFIWQQGDWPNWRFDHQRLAQPLAEVHQSQGRLLGRLHELGVRLREQATLQVLTEDVLKTSEIEGEKLNADSVRSSLARRLGVDIGGLAPVDRNVEGVVDMVLDATRQHASALTPERLFGWHAALYPTGYSGLSRIRVGAWRDDTLGPMQVVSGPLGRQKVHYEAPPAHSLAGEMSNFLCWFNGDQSADPVIKAGLAHLWLVTVHPFEDGNGRIARAVGDMALARGERSTQRFYSVSAQMQRERRDYYDWLERTQKGTLEVTDWLEWFVGCLLRAVDAAEETLAAVLTKASFCQELPCNRINPFTRHSRRNRSACSGLGVFEDRVVGGETRGGFSKCVRPRGVTAVASGGCAPDIDNDDIPLNEYPIACLVVRTGAIWTTGDDDEVNSLVFLCDRISDVPGNIPFRANRCEPLWHLSVNAVDRGTCGLELLYFGGRLAHA